jgi:hypothetical protein
MIYLVSHNIYGGKMAQGQVENKIGKYQAFKKLMREHVLTPTTLIGYTTLVAFDSWVGYAMKDVVPYLKGGTPPTTIKPVGIPILDAMLFGGAVALNLAATKAALGGDSSILFAVISIPVSFIVTTVATYIDYTVVNGLMQVPQMFHGDPVSEIILGAGGIAVLIASTATAVFVDKAILQAGTKIRQ